MHRLECLGLKLPEVYVCRTRAEAKPLADAGLPYLVTRKDDFEILKIVLLRTLRRKFPWIDWNSVLDIDDRSTLNVKVPGGECGRTSGNGKWAPNHVLSDVAEEERTFGTPEGNDEEGGEPDWRDVDLSEYCSGETANVNVEVLQDLGFLPKFMDDAVDAIKVNLTNRMRWSESYNKRLGTIGDLTYGTEAPNLIVLDVSGSIPEGISATMLTLVETLREQAQADLIVTGSQSRWYGYGEELPSPEKIRSSIGYGNENDMFAQILEDHVAGKTIGTVISFGDNDTPAFSGGSYGWRNRRREFTEPKVPDLSGTKVNQVLHYHTWDDRPTGYAKWADECGPERVEFDTSWCSMVLAGPVYE